MNIHFYKYQGTGNDFIMIDDREKSFPASDTDLITRLCDRRFGIGADGLILLQPHPTSDFYMQYFNSDGRESSMCGNGGRCIVAFARFLKVIHQHTRFTAIDGLHEATIHQERVELKMSNVQTIERRSENTFVLDTGSPHYIEFRNDDIDSIDIVTPARSVRYNTEFKANGINVNFVNALGPDSIHIRTYERGVEDETLSCGTGVTAASIALALRNNDLPGTYTIHVRVMGGWLEVSYTIQPDTLSATDIWLKGPAQFVFDGKMEI